MATIRPVISIVGRLGDERVRLYSEGAADRWLADNPGGKIERKRTGWKASVRRLGQPALYATFAKRAEADAWAAEQEAAIAQGTLRVHAAHGLTVADVMRRYAVQVSAHKQVGRREVAAIERLLGYIGDLPWRDDGLTVEAIVGYVDRRRAEGVTSDTIRKELNPLSNCLNIAPTLWGLPPVKNAVSLAKPMLRQTQRLVAGVKRERRVTAAEEALIATVQRAQPRRAGELGAPKRGEVVMTRAFRFALDTAMRRGELCQITMHPVQYLVEGAGRVIYRGGSYLHAAERHRHAPGSVLSWSVSPEVSYLDIGARTLHLPGAITKTGQPRTIPLFQDALDILLAMPRSEDGRFFPLHPDSITHWIGKRAKRLGLHDLHWHDVRHEATCRLFELGLGIEEVSLIQGDDWQTLRRYTHLRPEALAMKLVKSQSENFR